MQTGSTEMVQADVFNTTHLNQGVKLQFQWVYVESQNLREACSWWSWPNSVENEYWEFWKVFREWKQNSIQVLQCSSAASQDERSRTISKNLDVTCETIPMVANMQSFPYEDKKRLNGSWMLKNVFLLLTYSPRAHIRLTQLVSV